jgi:NAD(P)-dependent dehydrogenase (short-subunit alcohol dehydrogenase family)
MITKDPLIQANQLRPFVADLSDLKAVKAAAEQLMKETDRLDILVNNASL